MKFTPFFHVLIVRGVDFCWRFFFRLVKSKSFWPFCFRMFAFDRRENRMKIGNMAPFNLPPIKDVIYFRFFLAVLHIFSVKMQFEKLKKKYEKWWLNARRLFCVELSSARFLCLSSGRRWVDHRKLYLNFRIIKYARRLMSCRETVKWKPNDFIFISWQVQFRARIPHIRTKRKKKKTKSLNIYCNYFCVDLKV